jgi:hypothetical protein
MFFLPSWRGGIEEGIGGRLGITLFSAIRVTGRSRLVF